MADRAWFGRTICVFGSVLLGWASGCSLTPTFRAPEVVTEIQNAQSFHEAGGVADADRALVSESVAQAWWHSIGDQELVALIAQLDAGNLDLAAAMARIDQSRALMHQARSDRLPTLSLSVDRGRQRQVFAVDDSTIEGFYGSGLQSRFDLDLFGGLRRAHRAARLRAQAAELSARSLRQALVSETARNFVDAYTLSERIKLAEQLAQSFATTVSFTQQRYRAGSTTTTALDVQIARQNQAAAEATVPLLQAQYELQLQALDILLARIPGKTQLRLSKTPDVDRLTPLDPGVPALLLSRRPDVAAAELQYRSALADVGAARARLFPALSVGLTGSLQTTQASEWFDVDGLIGSLTASLLAPVYQGGRLRAAVAAAQASARELAATYAQSALQALADVERALLLEATSDQRISRLKRSVDAAMISDGIAQERYASGQSSILTVLETRRALNSAEQELLLAQQDRLNARIDLYLAMGGEWQSSSR